MKFAIEIEKVGPDGWITRLKRGRRTETFDTRVEAETVADVLDQRQNEICRVDGSYVRYEVIEFPEEG